MSSTRHAVMRGPSLTGFGYRPLFTPAHHVDFETGIGPSGAMMLGSLTNPAVGSRFDPDMSASVQLRTRQFCPVRSASGGNSLWPFGNSQSVSLFPQLSSSKCSRGRISTPSRSHLRIVLTSIPMPRESRSLAISLIASFRSRLGS